MKEYLWAHFSEFAHKRAILMREEAQLWDILARDLKREAIRREETVPARRWVREPTSAKVDTGRSKEDRLFVRVSEAMQMMGMGRGSLYNEINAGRLKIRKSGRKTLIAVSDIQKWFENLPTVGDGLV